MLPNAAKLEVGLRGLTPKALFVPVLVAGIAISLPFWLAATLEQRQHLTVDAASTQVAEKYVGPHDVRSKEESDLKQMPKPQQKNLLKDVEQQVWLKDLATVIEPWVNDATKAESIARWVTIYADRFDLSPELILAVIAVESQFDQFAVSNVGARGLMQVMPFWKNHLGSPQDNLFDIETNIRYGCAIIRKYLDRYGRLDKALAAYNGSLGSGRYAAKVFERMKAFKASAADLAG